MSPGEVRRDCRKARAHQRGPHAAGNGGQERLSGRTAEYEKAEERMSKKPPEIERTPGGGLPRMTPAQRRRANALVRKTCCNYDNGNCLLLDDGEECVCPQTISYSVCCKWFRWAVLPHSCGVSRCWYADLLRAKLTRSDFWTFCPEVAALWRASPAGNISFGRSFTCACPSMN